MVGGILCNILYFLLPVDLHSFLCLNSKHIDFTSNQINQIDCSHKGVHMVSNNTQEGRSLKVCKENITTP